MKGIFHPDKYNNWDLSEQEIRALDPIEDRFYLEHNVQYALGYRRKLLMKKLGISELPENRNNIDDPSDELYEDYFVLSEQVAREPDAELLKEAVYEAPPQMARFAFCYLTKYAYPSPQCDAYSYRTYECGWKEGMTTEDVMEFCREMIAVHGPFVSEAKEILADPPRDHNDHCGKRMVSHEREISEPPYVRKERLAPFSESAEYEQSRADVLRLEALGREALASGDKDNAIMLFLEMSRKSKQLGKYTQRWEALDDYARSCIAIANMSDFANEAEDAAALLKRLIGECPEDKAYREHLEQAEAVFRKAKKETAAQTGFADEESPIVFYHSFEPKYADVFCRLIEERFRERGGKREIEFRRQEADFLPKEARVDAQHEIGDICCCDLPAMVELYYTTKKISAISPFIDTGNVLPEILEQGRIEEDVCGLPVLVFAAPPGFRTFFAFMNNYNYGLKELDCLDLLMLMTDSDFLVDVCKACNEGDNAPHVFPADKTVCARLAEEEPGYTAIFGI
jgi:hypothetical protein